MQNDARECIYSVTFLTRKNMFRSRLGQSRYHGNRSDRRDRIGSEQAKHRKERQYDPAGDYRLGNQYNLSASLGDLGKLLELRFDP